MLSVSTFLQTGSVASVVYIILGMFILAVAALFYVRKKTDAFAPKSAVWIIRNDARIAQIVMILSYFDASSFKRKRKSMLARKRIRLVLEMQIKVREYNPEAPIKEVQNICRDLLLMSQYVRNKRDTEE